jgi:Peptidase family M1 domain
MPPAVRCLSLPVAACLFVMGGYNYAQNTQISAANSDGTYQQLRHIKLSGDAVSVNNLVLKRDAATFHLRSGTVCFVTPVLGRVTGAVFVGDGNMTLTPPNSDEATSLKRLTKGDEFSEDFNHLVLRFTDLTYDQIKKAGTPGSGGCDAGLLEDSQHITRKKLNYNISARILQDLLNAQEGGFFVAFVHGKHYDDKLLYFIDPDGAVGVAPEQVELLSWGENKSGSWTSFYLSPEYRSGLGPASQPTSGIHIDSQQLETTIEKNAHLTGKASTTIVSEANGLRVVGLNLFPTLRVESVRGQDGQALSFIQEDKDDDPDFYVILPKALSRGDKYTIVTAYGGKDAVKNEGSGNYYPIARENWYPSRGGGLGDYSKFAMTFRIPKGMKMAATGSLVSETTDAGQNVTVWKSDTAQPTAGFQFGNMKEEDAKLTSPDFLIAAYANEEPPDWALNLRGGAMGNLSTISMMKEPLSQAQYAIGLYEGYFGPLPFKRLNLTQQTACNYGQSWPGLVWLPICSFYDSTVRHVLGLDFSDNIYWKVVTPHEVAHQWWGQTVGFDSYRDQWMSEGFADFSASLFLQSAYGKNGQKEFINFWNEERKSLTERNAEGFRAIDVGPVTMGYRTSNSKTGNIGARLIYPKGAYILHMIRMMMWDRQDGDQNFKEMMQDFVKTYQGRPATTEDFKTMVEKHMNAQMKSFGEGSMDWFFNEYVYGTALPSYRLDAAIFDNGANGDVIFNIKLTQSGVDDKFRMLVPIYIELASGQMYFLGRARMIGNSAYEQKIPLKGLKDKPRRAVVNYYDDVLASAN